MKTHRLFLVLAGFSLFLLCNRCILIKGRYYDIRLPGEGVNPTSYVFDFPKAEVMKTIDSCFSNHYLKDSSFSPPKSIYLPRIRNASLHTWEGKHEIKIDATDGHPKSYVFRQKRTKERLTCAYYYDLFVDSLTNNKTRVTLVYEHSSVLAGGYLMFNPLDQTFNIPRFLDLGSTTIEEYEILMIIGKTLGQKGMPPVNYPSGVTLEEVKEEFTVEGVLTLPFTEEDMVFGLPESADSLKQKK